MKDDKLLFVTVRCSKALTGLLGSDSSVCRCAAAATLCNVSWYAAPRASMLAAGTIAMLVSVLWDEEQECRLEAAYALAALTSSCNEPVCAAAAAAGGIPRLVALLEGGLDQNSSSSSSDEVLANEGANSVPTNNAGLVGPVSKGTSRSATCNMEQACSGATAGPTGTCQHQKAYACNNRASSSSHHQQPNPGDFAASSTADTEGPEIAAAALAVIGNLATGSASRRTEIVTTAGALQCIVSYIESADAACGSAALQALLQITPHADSWRLVDKLIVALIKHTGAEEMLLSFLNRASSEEDGVDRGDMNMQRRDALVLLGRLTWPSSGGQVRIG